MEKEDIDAVTKTMLNLTENCIKENKHPVFLVSFNLEEYKGNRILGSQFNISTIGDMTKKEQISLLQMMINSLI